MGKGSYDPVPIREFPGKFRTYRHAFEMPSVRKFRGHFRTGCQQKVHTFFLHVIIYLGLARLSLAWPGQARPGQVWPGYVLCVVFSMCYV